MALKMSKTVERREERVVRRVHCGRRAAAAYTHTGRAHTISCTNHRDDKRGRFHCHVLPEECFGNARVGSFVLGCHVRARRVDRDQHLRQVLLQLIRPLLLPHFQCERSRLNICGCRLGFNVGVPQQTDSDRNRWKRHGTVQKVFKS